MLYSHLLQYQQKPWFLANHHQLYRPSPVKNKWHNCHFGGCVSRCVHGTWQTWEDQGKIDNWWICNTVPVAHNQPKIPYNLNEKAKREEQRLVELGIIKAVRDDQPITWCTNPVIAPKPHNPEAIRYCSDMRAPNTAIKRPVTEVPTVTDIKFKLEGAKVFRVLDMNEGYQLSWRKAAAILLHSMVPVRTWGTLDWIMVPSLLKTFLKKRWTIPLKG